MRTNTVRRLLSTSALAVAALVLCFHSQPARASCSASEVRELYSKHVSVEKIADRCEMRLSDVEALVDEADAVDPDPADSPGQMPPRQAMCCDAAGFSRCQIGSGSTAIGTMCFCPGQGYGIICR
jgi:hypothetical protein